jgi:predicted permease
VIIEVALSIVLLIGGGLMMRSFVRLVGEKTGMDPSHVATMEATFPQTTVSTGRSRIITGVIDRLTGQPGIVAAGAVNDLPLRGGGGIVVTVDVPGAPAPGPGEYRWVRSLFAAGAYFDAMGIARVRGRTFTASDATGLPVAIISTTMAERFWPGVDPLGRQFSLRGDTASFTVVGVVADVRDRGLDMAPIPQMYRPMEPGPLNAAIVVRGTLPPRALIARLTSAMHDVAPGQAVFNVRMMTDVVRASVRPRRTNTLLFGVFAALGLMLSALGVYAVVAYGVAQRSRELGIRVALGATGRDLLTLVSQDMIVTLAIGVVIGLGAAWGLSRVLASLLYGVDPRDPATFSLVPLALVLPVIVATVIPALRAARTEPTRVMRSD